MTPVPKQGTVSQEVQVISAAQSKDKREGPRTVTRFVTGRQGRLNYKNLAVSVSADDRRGAIWPRHLTKGRIQSLCGRQ